MSGLRAVVFDWRGTLVTTLDTEDWIRAALLRIGRTASAETVARLVQALTDAAGEPDRLDSPGMDSDRNLHRDTCYQVFADAEFDEELADALYAVESDPAYNPFALDVAQTFEALAEHGCRVAVLSDIHFDLRPAFTSAGLADFVTEFVLSFEHGAQKPDPAIFRRVLDRLGTSPPETLMVGDRASHDGAALAIGMPTLLVPPLTDVTERRLHHVPAMVIQGAE